MKVRDAPSLESLRQEAQPFVLIDFGGRGRLYRNPSHIVEARRGAEVLPALRSLAGKRAAGFISYEAGYALEP